MTSATERKSSVVAPSSADGVGRAAVGASFATLVSRITGFVRTWMLVIAIGTGALADSYNFSNNVPNMILLLLGGGTIATTFVPRLVQFDKISRERGNQYATLLLIGSAVVGVVCTAVAFVLIWSTSSLLLTGSTKSGVPTLPFILWLTPQVFFYVICNALIQIANARGKFASVAWTYAISSVFVIAGCAVILVASLGRAFGGTSDFAVVTLLGACTLIGTIAQAAALYRISRRLGFAFQMPSALKGFYLRETAITGVWTLGSAAMYQCSNIVVAYIAVRVGIEGTSTTARGYSALLNAQMILYFAQAIFVSSISNVLLQRLSESIVEKNEQQSRADFEISVFRLGSLLIPISVLGMITGSTAVAVVFSLGASDSGGGNFVGLLVAIYMAGLVPFGLHPMFLRAHYAHRNAITPLMSAVRISVLWIALSIISAVWLPHDYVAIGLVTSFVVAYAVDLPVKASKLRSAGYGLARDQIISLSYLALAGITAAVIAAGAAWYDLLLNHFGFECWSYLAQITAPLRIILRGAIGGVIFVLLYYALTFKRPGSIGGAIEWLRQ